MNLDTREDIKTTLGIKVIHFIRTQFHATLNSFTTIILSDFLFVLDIINYLIKLLLIN